MNAVRNKCSLTVGFLILLFSCAAFFVNSLFFHFTGNNYVPPGAIEGGLCLLAIVLSLRYFFDKNHYACRVGYAVLSLYLVMATIAVLTNAVQYTPFSPIDSHLIAFERVLHIDMARIVSWTARQHSLQQILTLIYATLPYQMSLLPLVAALFCQFDKLNEYFCLMLLTAMIGFIFYYFFPTLAPASMINSPYFTAEQHATGIKFKEIHNHLPPSTSDGGMIAMPSFHVIWAWLCLYLLRGLKPAFFILLPINLLLVASCVLLGWHYLIDVAGSIVVIGISHSLVFYQSHRSAQYID